MAGPDINATRKFGGTVDFGRAAGEYRAHRAGFPDRFFRVLSHRKWAVPGARALDLGTGTGTVARGLARLGLTVEGLDPSEALMAEAGVLDAEAGVTVTYRTGKAEAPGGDDSSLDLITAGQCWHWFDRSRAAAEAFRLLRPGGRIVIAHFDWLPLAGNIVAATEDLILRHNPAWTLGGGTGLYPGWFADLAGAGFGGIESFSFDHEQPYSHEAWRGRIRASAGVKASLTKGEVARFDAEMAKLLAARFPEEPLNVPHRVWAVSGIRPED
ncbi:class I SAM-dependent methyltransferase [Defluviimonas sp. WL0050]|uniref:Class I SAM-dependent methyltransferase n=1 Tax=Albidovulum litorale TaxID=2984134 RepID=A0ABT2ZQC7_9RHOB|nr:class I SAM-dependent methyltransferase [Defluviimonas sp. WL0050]MCV2873366.1 class I SAM-dependent methyltransferase [Defluviimonas sp. WL0050]